MQKARRHARRALRPLAGARFQGLFHSSARGAFHLSLTVLVRYRSLGSIQPCGMGPADSRRIPRAPRYSGAGSTTDTVSPKGLSPAPAPLSSGFGYHASCNLSRRSYNPGRALTHPVWARARSLAATCAITFVFFSCGYWDVSVPRVRPAP